MDSVTRYGTEHPPNGTLNVAGIVIDMGVFLTSTVYLVRDVYAAEMDAYVLMISNA